MLIFQESYGLESKLLSLNFRVGLNLEVTRFLIHFNVLETSFSYSN